MKIRFMGKAMLGCFISALGVYFTHLLYSLKEPRSAGYAVGFEGRGDGKTDGFLGSCRVGDNKICVQRVKASVNTLDRSIE